jgi:hypothetical protein
VVRMSTWVNAKVDFAWNAAADVSG